MTLRNTYNKDTESKLTYYFQQSRAIQEYMTPTICDYVYDFLEIFRFVDFCKKNKNSGFTSDLCDILIFTFLVLLPKEDQSSNKSWSMNS